MRLVPFVLAVALTLAMAASAEAAAVSWDTPSGSSPGNVFDYSGGESGDGSLPAGDDLWGDPDVADDGFRFNHMEPTFKAEASDGASDSIVSTMQVMVTGTPGPFYELHVREYGTYSGDWNDGDFDPTYGTLAAFFFNPFMGQVALGDLNIGPTGPDTWEATLDVDLTDFVGAGGATQFQIQVTNHLHVESDVGDTDWIRKTGGSVIIPEPATLLLGVGGLAVMVLGRPRRGASR